MEPNKGKWLIICFVAFALVGNVNAPFESYKCAAGDGNDCGDGTEPTVMCNTDPGGNCDVICAAQCGFKTACVGGSCSNCCSADICNKYPVASDEYEVCMESCKGTCEVNGEFCGVILILQSIAAGLAVLMLAVNGFKWMTADDAQGRIDARRGVFYIFIGLALVIIAFALVNYLYVGEVSCP